MFCNLSVRLSTLPALALLALAACNQSDDTAAPSARECGVPGDTPVHLPGGTFTMGDNAVYPQEEGPPRETTVGGFWIDPHEVTNRQFAEFVDATDYVTVAEKPVDPAVFGVPASQIPAELLLPGSAVFVAPDHPTSNPNDWWFYTPGANWRFPFGPDGPAQVADEPVVHLAYEDMLAYAAWRGGRLPTEAEWEYAATAGAGHYSDQPTEANSWQGLFPVVNEDTDGFVGIAPVGCFAPNPSGLYDMIGN
ncbi:MAG: SUMF1/EgtB/PvdO family nonheme iron enzyme, partial [Erythrobacter sp.]|nr:SUMF1/EgtB/PvdO family nonheme iron enzyme [Erythrobacter sp.]